MQNTFEITEIPIPIQQHPLAGVLNELWEKILDEEISIFGSSLVEKPRAEAKRILLETAHLITEVLTKSDDVDSLTEEIQNQILSVLQRPKPRSYSGRILKEDLQLLRARLKYKKLRDVFESHKKPDFLNDESRILTNDGRLFEAEEVGYIVGSSCSIYRVYGRFEGSKPQTYVVKSDSAGDVLEWRSLRDIGLPVFETYLSVKGGGVLMDDLDRNGERLTISMNCLRGASWRHIQDYPIEIFCNLDQEWIEQYFECAILAGKAGRLIPSIAYFFNFGKDRNTDLQFLLGDYGELESFRNKIIPSGSKRSLSWYNVNQAYEVLGSFLRHALHSSDHHYLNLLDNVYDNIKNNL